MCGIWRIVEAICWKNEQRGERIFLMQSLASKQLQYIGKKDEKEVF